MADVCECPEKAQHRHFFPGRSKRCLCGLTQDEIMRAFSDHLRKVAEQKDMGWP